MTTERAAFEAHFAGALDLTWSGGDYQSSGAAIAWRGWKACSALLATSAARYQWLRDCGPEWRQLEVLDARGDLMPDALDEAIDLRRLAYQQKTDLL